MKPIVITIAPNKDGIIQLTTDKLSELLDQAYNAGKADGKDSNFECPYIGWKPIIDPLQQPYYYNYCVNEPTCSASSGMKTEA